MDKLKVQGPWLVCQPKLCQVTRSLPLHLGLRVLLRKKQHSGWGKRRWLASNEWRMELWLSGSPHPCSLPPTPRSRPETLFLLEKAHLPHKREVAFFRGDRTPQEGSREFSGDTAHTVEEEEQVQLGGERSPISQVWWSKDLAQSRVWWWTRLGSDSLWIVYELALQLP